MKEIWLSVKEVALITGKSERTIRRTIKNFKFIEKTSRGGSKGKSYKILLSSLPVEAIENYYRVNNIKREKIKANDVELGFAIERKRFIDEFEKYFLNSGLNNKKEALKEYLKTNKIYNKKISVQTFFRWQKAYREEGLEGLIPRWSERESGRKADFSEDAKKYAYSLFFQESKPSARSVYTLLEIESEKRGWELPSYRTFLNFLKAFPEDVWIKTREGKKAYYDKFLPYIERNSEELSPMEIIVGDHHQIDVAVIDKRGKVFFPWLTAWMDQRSKKIVGYYVSRQPNSSTILYSLKNVIEDYGVPKRVYVDNGKDYRSKTFMGKQKRFKVEINSEAEGIFYLLGITPIFAIPYNARAKNIERFFKTFTLYFSKFQKGYRGSNVKERPEKVAKEIKDRDLMSFDEFKKRIDDFIVFYNTKLKNKGLNATPDEVFYNNEYTKVGITQEVKRLLFMKISGFRKVSRNGIWIFDNWYRDERLLDYFGKKVVVRYDPEDLGKVFVYDMKGRFICEAERFLKAENFYATEELYKKYKRTVKRAKKRVDEIEKAWRISNVGFDDFVRAEMRKEEEREEEVIKMVVGMENIKIKRDREDDDLSEIGERFLESLASMKKDKEDDDLDINKYL